MNSRIILSINAIILLASGGILLFLSNELCDLLTVEHLSKTSSIALAALLLGLGTVSWHSRGLTVGGIYGRPVVLGNLIHHTVGSFSFLKMIFTQSGWIIVLPGIYYTVFALLFFFLMTRHPNPKV